MNKAKLLKIVNPILALLALHQVVNIVALRLGAGGLAHELHEWNAYALVAVAAFHVYLNWSWIKSSLLKGQKPAA